MIVRFEVVGVPVPQGSKRAFVPKGQVRPVIVDDNRAALRTWRSQVTEAARVHVVSAFTSLPAFRKHVPVAVKIEFRLDRPGSLRDGERPFPSVTPDLDKLTRAVLDAATDAGVWKDDAQVVQVLASKIYATGGTLPGATIEIRPVLG